MPGAMATMITSECINCGACEPECPNTAIYQGGVEWQAPDGAMHPALSAEIFYIVPEKCTECVGFHDQEACAAVCPVDCCVPNPDIPETHDVLLARARALHSDQTIPDDAPSRFKKEGGAAAPAPAAAAPAPAAPAPASAPPAAAAEEVGPTLPDLDAWDVPIRCFRCSGAYSVPYASYRAGVVFRCPHCNGSLVPTLSMVRAVGEAMESFHAHWTEEFERFGDRRRRELEAFEQRQQRALQDFEERVKTIAARETAPGTPRKRRGFFSF
jgi:ferredoxin